VVFYGDEMLAPCPTPRGRTTPSRLYAATPHIWRPYPPSAVQWRTMPWWQSEW